MRTCDTPELHVLLDSVADTHEIVVRRADEDDVLRAAWLAARDDVRDAWTAWSRQPSDERWAVYVAARDREDAAVAVIRAQLV